MNYNKLITDNKCTKNNNLFTNYDNINYNTYWIIIIWPIGMTMWSVVHHLPLCAIMAQCGTGIHNNNMNTNNSFDSAHTQ